MKELQRFPPFSPFWLDVGIENVQKYQALYLVVDLYYKSNDNHRDQF